MGWDGESFQGPGTGVGHRPLAKKDGRGSDLRAGLADVMAMAKVVDSRVRILGGHSTLVRRRGVTGSIPDPCRRGNKVPVRPPPGRSCRDEAGSALIGRWAGCNRPRYPQSPAQAVERTAPHLLSTTAVVVFFARCLDRRTRWSGVARWQLHKQTDC